MLALSLVHWPKSAPLPPLYSEPEGKGLLEFETCQRRIWIDLHGLSQNPSHQGEQAYSFLLEVICGLHSRIFGETEILGQFKAFVKKHPELSPWSSWLLEDAKMIRSHWLRDVGAHSYGSVVRRWCASKNKITILGTGQLSAKLTPWLKGASQLRSRNLETLPESDAVVIAAPIPDLTLMQLQLQKPSALWIDLRGERGAFRAELHLEHLYAELERESHERQKLLPQIQSEIQKLSRSRMDRMWCRPQGWEDLA
jgi:glutamyl-tRNA reductase